MLNNLSLRTERPCSLPEVIEETLAFLCCYLGTFLCCSFGSQNLSCGFSALCFWLLKKMVVHSFSSSNLFCLEYFHQIVGINFPPQESSLAPLCMLQVGTGGETGKEKVAFFFLSFIFFFWEKKIRRITTDDKELV